MDEVLQTHRSYRVLVGSLSVKAIIKRLPLARRAAQAWRERRHVEENKHDFLIDPSSIEWTIWQPDLEKHLGKIPPRGRLSGDWDLIKHPFRQTEVYNGLQQRFLEGASWADTVYYTKLRDGFLAHKVAKAGGIDEFLARYDALYARIVSCGYDTTLDPPVVVHGGRGRNLIRHDGNHRLSIALLLGVSRIRVRYHLVHPEHESIFRT